MHLTGNTMSDIVNLNNVSVEHSIASWTKSISTGTFLLYSNKVSRGDGGCLSHFFVESTVHQLNVPQESLFFSTYYIKLKTFNFFVLSDKHQKLSLPVKMISADS